MARINFVVDFLACKVVSITRVTGVHEWCGWVGALAFFLNVLYFFLWSECTNTRPQWGKKQAPDFKESRQKFYRKKYENLWLIFCLYNPDMSLGGLPRNEPRPGWDAVAHSSPPLLWRAHSTEFWLMVNYGHKGALIFFPFQFLSLFLLSFSSPLFFPFSFSSPFLFLSRFWCTPTPDLGMW